MPWGSHAEGVQGPLSRIEQAWLLGQSDTLLYGTKPRTQTERDVGTPVDGQAQLSFPLTPTDRLGNGGCVTRQPHLLLAGA